MQNLWHNLVYNPMNIKLICFIKIYIYFQAWPEDALELVAHKFFDDVEMSQEVRDETVFMCKHFHQSVRALSEKFVVYNHFFLP